MADEGRFGKKNGIWTEPNQPANIDDVFPRDATERVGATRDEIDALRKMVKC